MRVERPNMTLSLQSSLLESMASPPYGMSSRCILHDATAYPVHRLVATLGSKSGLKKINRKAILDVDIPKACSTVTEPEAPMALRLQSNLL